MSELQTSPPQRDDLLAKIREIEEFVKSKTIISLLRKWSDILSKSEDTDFCMKQLKDIVNEIKNNKLGKLYETIIYCWLSLNHIAYSPQIFIESSECFKKSDKGYHADGRINENEIIFDVKKFGISIPQYQVLQEKLQSVVNKEHPYYIITISGSMNIDNKMLQKEYLESTDRIIEQLFKNPSINGSYMTNYDELEIKAIHSNISSALRTFNAYEWAENNKYYYLSHSSQFCINKPYIIFSVFDSSQSNMIMFSDESSSFQYLRIFCRRVYIELTKIHDRYIHEYDGKGKEHISVAAASKKISAIVFMDINANENDDIKTYVFVNPNADNKIPRYQIDTMFRNNGASLIEDYKYDNY